MSGYRGSNEECVCPPFLRGMLKHGILLLLGEGINAHGYEIHASLKDLGFDLADDTGRVYRALRNLESEGMVSSEWDTTGSGPARRVYVITDRGWDFLLQWGDSLPDALDFLRSLQQRLDRAAQKKEDEVANSEKPAEG